MERGAALGAPVGGIAGLAVLGMAVPGLGAVGVGGIFAPVQPRSLWSEGLGAYLGLTVQKPEHIG